MKEPLGQRIKKARKKFRDASGKRITQVELARRVGTSQSAISQIESGETETPLPHTLVALARELNCDFGEEWLREFILKKDEQRLVDCYRALPAERRSDVIAYVEVLYRKYGASPPGASVGNGDRVIFETPAANSSPEQESTD